MYPPNMVFTSESVTEGHPDKLCDQVSDTVLDACLAEDPESRVACETYVTLGMMIIGGEITTRAPLDVEGLVRRLGNEIGYSSALYGYDVNTAGILRAFHQQSPDIAQGVSRAGEELGAGDQGIMFGFACRQTDELMPLPIMLAHRLAMRLSEVRRQKVLPFLGPDGKSQVTVEYRDGKPVRVEHVVLACQHTSDVVTPDRKRMAEEAKQQVIDAVVHPVLGDLADEKTRFTVNGAGKFLVGGPQADAGLTGRKVIVDTYGGWAMHGGGAFSGKDPTKVDRSAGYMARYIAKNIGAAELADECLLQLGYCIGQADPMSVMVNTFGTSGLADGALSALVRDVFPLSPKGMIDHLKLREPIYRKTAAYGHFGRPGFSWENVDATEVLLAGARKRPGS
ncbi:MAG: methionine adenosyltransferase [Mycobacterium sp.]|uniref:methionine adenosyltransferase n=1 Tax=Mycobacterium sp. TaxID=1785 RepID=UPI003F95ECED